jgi:uncharacterized membrane protein YidH (DUF202 family)
MKKEQDYIQDIAEIRSMMERSSKFLSLSGWAGIMAGIYALLGAYIAYTFLNFDPDELFYISSGSPSSGLLEVILLAFIILILALGTAVFLSYERAGKRNEKLWNPTAKKLLVNIMVPLVVGGILIFFMITKGLIGLVAPFSLLFYGLALFNAGKYTYQEVKILGLIEIILGLIGSWFVEYGLLFWALGFGVVHIIYGIHMNFKYEK